ncbi:hypothetical protein OUZ56_033842 [Daphnia magna]|uniref:C2 domain-containing protein n=1 Tax=Daphnia magna TaxID=35525 RepID=A0ABR0BB66_9CRUS|nr:hypothetical protein OUZ56_033842 [Daphnia magna]
MERETGMFALCSVAFDISRYAFADEFLHVNIERARNLVALLIENGHKLCIKVTLLPCPVEAALSCCTRSITDLSQAVFDESFRLAVASTKLDTKTLQISVYSRPATSDSHEECLGWAQVSLADFRPDTNSVKWYNILALRCLSSSSHPLTGAASETGTGLKEESSDESTIVTSQPSTLTRNQSGPMSELELVEQGTDSEDEENSDAEDHKQANWIEPLGTIWFHFHWVAAYLNVEIGSFVFDCYELTVFLTSPLFGKYQIHAT